MDPGYDESDRRMFIYMMDAENGTTERKLLEKNLEDFMKSARRDQYIAAIEKRDNDKFTPEQEERFSSFYSDFRDDAQDAYLYRHSYEMWKENQLRKYKEREIVSRIMRDYKLSDTEWVDR